MMRMRTFDEMLSKQLKDEEFRKEYDAVKLLNGAVFASKVTGTSTKKVSDIATISMLEPSRPDLCGTFMGL